MTSVPALPAGVSRITERVSGPLRVLENEVWSAEAGVVQGTTTRTGAGGFDLGLFSGGQEEAVVRENWLTLARHTGFADVVHARQVHGADVHVVDAGRPSGVPRLLAPADGHVTDRPGVLLAVTTADCVPVFLRDARGGAVGAVHAGWRGVAAGVLERAFEAMEAAFGTHPSDLAIHLGPAICGVCYEVGPEVFEALGQPVPDGPTPIDVRAVLAARGVEAGVPAGAISVSTHCTRCTGSRLYSHRAGDAERQVGYIGIRGAGA